MMRAYFLVPDTSTAKTIIDELLLKHVEWRHLHVIANKDVSLEELPEAELAQKSDLLPSLRRGALTGSGLGLFMGLVAMAVPPAGLTIAGGAVLAMAAGGAGFGALMATMIGVDVPNSRLKRFEEAIQEGKLLLMVDIPRDRVEEIQQVIHAHYPAADIQGTDPTIPVFP